MPEVNYSRPVVLPGTRTLSAIDQRLVDRGWELINVNESTFRLPLEIQARCVGSQYGGMLISVKDRIQPVSAAQKEKVLQLFDNHNSMKSYVQSLADKQPVFDFKEHWGIDEVLKLQWREKVNAWLQKLGCQALETNVNCDSARINIVLERKTYKFFHGVFPRVARFRVNIPIALSHVLRLSRDLDSKKALINQFGTVYDKAAYALFNAGYEFELQDNGEFQILQQGCYEAYTLDEANQLLKGSCSYTAETSF